MSNPPRKTVRMKRIKNLGRIATLLGVLVFASVPLRATDVRAESVVTNTAIRPVPMPCQLAWQNAEVTAMFTLDPRVFSEKFNLQTLQDTAALTDSDGFAQCFNPRKLDTDQWVATAKAMGASVAILVVKHETGFCLWQSDANPYCLKMLKWRDGKADLLRDFIASCKKFGIKPGVFTESRWDRRLNVDSYEVGKGSPVTQAQYDRLIESEIQELCTRYGELFMLWFDAGARAPDQGGPDLLPLAEKNQPGIIFYHSNQRRDIRWSGTESGIVADPCWATVPANLGMKQAGETVKLQGQREVRERPLMRQGDPSGSSNQIFLPAPARNIFYRLTHP
jgi:Alpha-L-fucosidase